MGERKSKFFLIGSMLFGMFFGAGNLIFPVFLGQQAGQNMLPAGLGFLITASGLPFLGVVSMGLVDSDNLLAYSSRVSKGFGYAMTLLLYLTIGPFFALPRTAAVSFEVGLAPVLRPEHVGPSLLAFSVLFFSVALFFALRPARILDWIGKFLNPIFLVFIGALFVIALCNPMGDFAQMPTANAYQAGAFTQGFVDGYQTMDALAALAFGGIVIGQIKQLGFADSKKVTLETAKSGLISVLLMCVIYSGLAWLGASSLGSMEGSINGGLSLARISTHYFGRFGSIFLTLTITVACLKTAIGLITSCSQAFVDMFPRSLSYRAYCVAFAALAGMVANVGLNQIIDLAVPVLLLLYPAATALILLSLLEPLLGYCRLMYVGGVVGALLAAVVESVVALPFAFAQGDAVQAVVDFCQTYLPLFQEGFGWLLPAAIGAVIGLGIEVYRKGFKRKGSHSAA